MSGGRARWKVPLLGVMLSIALAGGGLFVWWPAYARNQARERRGADLAAVYAAIGRIGWATQQLRDTDADKSGKREYWTGDVTGLYPIGLVSREIAEADMSPLSPLVETPKPYHGYFFMAMEVGDGEKGPTPIRSKADLAAGKTRHPTAYGFCAYPEESGGDAEKGHPVFLVGPSAVWRKTYGLPKAVVAWPDNQELKMHWARVD